MHCLFFLLSPDRTERWYFNRAINTADENRILLYSITITSDTVLTSFQLHLCLLTPITLNVFDATEEFFPHT